ncbi:hypothetical protein PTT_13604 [Pyrenophora teres f. teres 0-1]|uniref:Major facilitator superfamily (MFS) profile domain-containing protein n=1 Tax=Pyrenophora teres f. teres (strain 0-1) TaxID=861557 RepID=E3RWE8_PYRTT|nr:hypothetical protein PTT_13604 [Pyrenophora teres f. teres 0-1]
MFQHNGNSSTCVEQPIELQDVSNHLSKPQDAKVAGSYTSLRLSDTKGTRESDPVENLPSPTTQAAEKLERWNHPRSNLFRTMAAFWSFVVMGSNDAAYGALIPYLQEYYHLTFVVISLVFLSPLVGYTASALLNNTIHLKFGQRGVAIIAPSCHLIAYIVIAVHPPYPVLVVIFMLAGFGNGLADAAWNAWIGNMANPNEVLGFLHAFYGLGAVLSPLIATTMITKGSKLPWYTFYYVMIAMAFIELVTSITAFWRETGAVFLAANPRTNNTKDNRMKEALIRLPNARVTWLCSLFLLGYVGIEVALGGWIVKFMLEVRDGEEFASGMTATGFWMGITVGRIILGFVTPRLGEKLAIAIYLPLTMALELIFWLVPQFYVSAVAVSFQGFFLGPLFPAAIVAATKLLPRHLHVSAIGFAAAFGGSGAAIFPFAVGAIAQAKGVQFISSRGNEYFCEIDEEYLTDRFNLTGLNTEVQYYQYALDLVTDVFDFDCDDDMREQIEKSARHLYGLVHARYIVTTRGLAKMLEKFKKSDFGKCPRVMCESQPLLPMGQSDVPNASPVKLYCARCEDLYNPKSSRHAVIDGAYFGTSFHNILFQVYPAVLPPKSQRRYEPRVFGFKVHSAAALARWQADKKDEMKERLKKLNMETGFEEEDEELEEDDEDDMELQEGVEGAAAQL